MSGMQMTGMNEGRGRGSTVGRSGANDGAGATKTCPRCGAVLFSDMNRCYGCLYAFPEQDPEVGLMTPDELWEDVDEPWGSLDGLWVEGEAAVGGASPSADKRDAAFEEFTGMPDVMPGAEGESRAGVSEPSGVQSPSGATPGASFVRRVSSRHGSPTGATSPASVVPSFPVSGIPASMVSEVPASPVLSASVVPASPAPSHVVVPSSSGSVQKPVAFVRGVPCVRIQTPVSTVVVEVDGSNVTIRQEPLGDGEK